MYVVNTVIRFKVLLFCNGFLFPLVVCIYTVYRVNRHSIKGLSVSLHDLRSVYIYIFAGGRGGWTVRHTSDVITRKRRDVQDVHLCQYVTFIEINRIPPAMVYGVYGSRKSVASHTVRWSSKAGAAAANTVTRVHVRTSEKIYHVLIVLVLAVICKCIP